MKHCFTSKNYYRELIRQNLFDLSSPIPYWNITEMNKIFKTEKRDVPGIIRAEKNLSGFRANVNCSRRCAS
jgi:hypothetical protein